MLASNLSTWFAFVCLVLQSVGQCVRFNRTILSSRVIFQSNAMIRPQKHARGKIVGIVVDTCLSIIFEGLFWTGSGEIKDPFEGFPLKHTYLVVWSEVG